MGAFTYIETDTGTNVDISAATAVGAYTSTGDKLIMVDVSIDAVAGNGDYVMYVTRKIGGSGSAYRILPQTTMTAASGLTAISGQSGWITVRNGDVLTCYVDGLAGDTSTPDWSTRWFELAGVTAAAIADAVLDEATADHTTAGSLSKAVADILTDTGTTLDGKIDTIDGNVDAILADTGTDGVVLKAAGLDADAVTKIQNGLALEATLTAIKGAGWADETLAAIDVLIDAIKAKTDLIPATPAVADEYDAALAAIKAETALIVEDTGTTIPATITTIDDEIAVIDGIVDAILDDTGTTGVLLSTSALTSIFDDETIVGSHTFSDLLKIMAAALAGKVSGGGTTTVTFRGVDDASDVIVATVDANGNRSAVTLTV